MENLQTIIILGPTASGKTELAVRIAWFCKGEIISIDSRQVYRRMSIGTGKDYKEYSLQGMGIPHHLIDIRDPGYEYNIFEFLKDFKNSFSDISLRGKRAVLCGGSGMYLDAIINGYRLPEIKKDPKFVKMLEGKSDEELKEMLTITRKLHNTTDLLDRKRMIRALEIASVISSNNQDMGFLPVPGPVIIGIRFEREDLRKRITSRLEKRIEEGLVDEVKELLDSGLTSEQLKFYGLEYRYITQHLDGELSFSDMFQLLNTAIHQFAKRQMTWFRKIEREGHKIHWIDGMLETDRKVEVAKSIIKKNT